MRFLVQTKAIIVSVVLIGSFSAYAQEDEIGTTRVDITYDVANAFRIQDVGLNKESEGQIRDQQGFGLEFTQVFGKYIGVNLGWSSYHYSGSIFDQATVNFEATEGGGTKVTSNATNVEYKMDVKASVARAGLSLNIEGKRGEAHIPFLYILEGGFMRAETTGQLELLTKASSTPFAKINFKQEPNANYWRFGFLLGFTDGMHFTFGSKSQNLLALELESCDAKRIGEDACDTIDNSLKNRKQEYKPLESIMLGLGVNW